MAAGATGNPDLLKQAPQQVATRQRDADEGKADRHVIGKPGLDAEPREHDESRVAMACT